MTYGVGGTGVVPEAETTATPVPGTQIYLKRSEVKGKQPAYADAEYGELFVNYHSDDPMLCFKDNGGNIVALKPSGPIGNGPTPPISNNEIGDLWWDGDNLLVWNGSSWEVVGQQALGDLTDVDTTGEADGMVLAYDGTTWKPVSAASIAIDVDLGYTPAADKGTVTNTAGDDAEIPLANGTNAGLTLNNYTTAEKDKLTGVEDGAEANVNADWNATSGDAEILNKPDIPSELGDLSDVDTSDAANGKLLQYKDGIWHAGSPGAVEVNLGYTPAANQGTVTNDSGADAVIPLADGTNAGLSLNNYTTAEKDKLAGYPDDPANLPAPPTPNLQAVTDAGATTTNQIESANDQGYAFTHLSNKLALQSQNLSANYAIRFPPAPADADKRFLAAVGTNTSGNMDLAWVASGFDPAVLDDYLPLAGGNMTGGVTATVRTITASEFDLETGNLWECGGIAVPNPTNAVAGMTGVIVFSAAPIAFNTFFKFPDGATISPSSFPAVVPFYVASASEILLGKPVEGIA
jgi:hypothetical protein